MIHATSPGNRDFSEIVFGRAPEASKEARAPTMSMTLFVNVNLGASGGGTRREPIKVTPMMKLSDAVDGMLAKIGRQAPQGYEITLKRKPVDATLPVRFSGLQNRDTLDLELKSEAASTSQRAAPQRKEKPTTTAATATRRPPPQQEQAMTRPAPPGPSPSDLPADRDLIVFHEDLLASGQSLGSRSEDLGDDFYDFTAQDFARIQQKRQELARQEESRTLQTRAMRERERRQRAEEMPPVRVRVVLPDRWCLQCIFKATETVSGVYSYVASLVDCPSFVLFTTPPKCVLDRTSRDTLYDAGLVPAVKLHFGFKGTPSGGQIWKQGVVDKFSVHSADQVEGHGRRAKVGVSVATAKDQEAVPVKTQAASAEDKGKAKKAGVPKWLKLGK